MPANMEYELADDIYEKVNDLTENAENALNEGDDETAKELYLTALILIPEPRKEYEQSTFIYAGLGDIAFFDQEYEEALKYFAMAIECAEAEGNPFLELRLGQCYYQLDDDARAKDHLHNAYEIEGEEIFDDEDEEYFDLIKDMI